MKKKLVTRPVNELSKTYDELAKIYLSYLKPKTHNPTHDPGNLDNLKDIQFWKPIYDNA